MHKLNRLFWEKCEAKYPEFFHGVGRVLEVGSCNVNGSVRDHFSDVGTYIGVDWRAGLDVDLVCLASRMSFDERFDVVISASMLEHDPEWRLSLVNMVSQLKPDGILMLSWGAARNAPHSHSTAVDGEFHPRPAGQVISFLQSIGVYVHFFRYEAKLRVKDKAKPVEEVHSKGMGEVCLIAFKNPDIAKGPIEVDELLSEDNIGWEADPVLPQAGPKKPRRHPARRRGRK